MARKEGGFLEGMTEKFNSFLGSFEKPFSNITQNTKKVNIHVELPKVQDKDLTIVITSELVVIKASRGKKDHPDYTVFYRKIPLPAGLDIHNTTKKFSRGTLTLEIPMLPL
ncbi:MAG: Hsp20/alpha crystallin family protein [Nanoarchaeota archaeon]|nr:Hsp20/alpha crystallin family protein [Nanoarchaeota archaeon]